MPLLVNPHRHGYQGAIPGYSAIPATADMEKWVEFGGTHALVQVGWDNTETADGTWNGGNVAVAQAQIDAAVAAGLNVILEPALQYTPTWVQTAVPKFKNQASDEYDPASAGFNVRDWVWTATGRTILGDWINGILTRLDLSNVNGIRIGGGWFNELQFPPWNAGSSPGSAIRYWCFGTAAQTGTGLASGMTSATAAGVNGITFDSGALSDTDPYTPTSNDNLFQAWYTGSLTTFAGWLLDQVRAVYAQKPIYLMLPGVGMRAAWGKHSQGWRQELAEGKDWAAHIVGAFPGRGEIRGWSTWADYDDAGVTTEGETSPSRLLTQRLSAAGYGDRIVGGENANQEVRATRRESFSTMHSANGILGNQGYKIAHYVQWSHLTADDDSDLGYLKALIDGTDPLVSVGMSTGNFLHQIVGDLGLLDLVLDAIVNTGAKWVREEFNWPTIQPTSSLVFDWSAADTIVDACTDKGLEVVWLHGGSPAWARPTTYAAGDSSSPPDSPSTFATFCAAAATRYYLTVKHWEIWNEPNLKQFWGGVGAAFGTDGAVYGALMVAAYDAIKAVDSTATVFTAGLGMSATGGGYTAPVEFLDAALDVCAAKCDGIGSHPYGFPLLPSDNQLYDHGWRLQYLSTPSFKSVMEDHGVGHLKFYITEYGSPTNGPPIPTTVVSTTGVATEAAAGSTSVAANKPTLTAATSVVLVANFTATAAPTSVPSGWTLIPSATATLGSWHSSGYYKMVDASDVPSEPSTYTWGFASSAATVQIVPFYGCDLSTPIDVTATVNSNNNATTVVISQVTTTLNNSMLISGAGQDSTVGTLTIPSGMSSLLASPGLGKDATFAQELRATAGATGTRTWTFNSSALAHGGWLTAMRAGAITVGTVANNYSIDTYATGGLAYYNDENVQALQVEEAITLARARPDLFAQIHIYTLLDYEPPGTMTDREKHFGILESDGAPKDALAAMQDAITDTGGSA